MSDVRERIAALSPEQRELLLQRIADGGAAQAGSADIEEILQQRRLVGQRFPLSFAQERFWFLEQLQPDPGLYNIPLVYRLTGVVRVDAIQSALQQIVARHATLRTRFGEVDGEPFQVVMSNATVPLAVVDLSYLPADQQASTLAAQVAQQARRPFDLYQAPLVRFALWQLSPHEYVLLIVMHHIISDGWSVHLVEEELSAFYKGFVEGSSAPVMPLPLQYVDYACWQRKNRSMDVLASQTRYWRKQLDGDLPPLTLPAGSTAQLPDGARSARVSVTIAAATTIALKACAARSDATLSMVLLAAFKLLLFRWTRVTDMAVGTAVANRERMEFEPLIGVFLNTLVLRTDLAGNPTFRTLLQRVRRVATGAYNHQELAYEQLIRSLAQNRKGVHTPLFKVFFNMLNYDAGTLELPGVVAQTMPAPDVGSIFDLTLYAVERDGVLRLEFVYRPEALGTDRGRELLEQFELLLAQITERPNAPIESYSLVTPRGRRDLPDLATTLDVPEHQPVPEIVYGVARSHARAAAIRRGDRIWTYDELAVCARRISSVLAARGVEEGHVVAVTGARQFGLVAAMLGVLSRGAVLLPVDRHLPIARRRQLLQQAGARWLLWIGRAQDGDAATRSGFDFVRVIHIDGDTGALVGQTGTAAQETETLPVLSPDAAAYIFFTSGTTGTPKGVVGNHKGLSHFLHWQRQTFGIGGQDRVAQLTALSFDVVLRDIFLPLVSGATLCLPEDDGQQAPRCLRRWLRRERITVLHTVPSLARMWLEGSQHEEPLDSLRLTFFAGEPLNETLVRQWREHLQTRGEIVNLYGPTETTLAKCWYRVPREPDKGVQPIGQPLPQTHVFVLNRDRKMCGFCEPGEIVIRTPFRTKGYLDAEEKSQRFFPNRLRDDPSDLLYHTGDRGCYRPDGTLEIRGRLDGQVKIHGVRVEPGEVEAVVNTHSDVDACAVIAREDNNDQKQLVAYVVPRKETNPITAVLRSHVAGLLPAAFVPSMFVFLDSLPLTPNGKIDRQALPQPSIDRDISTVPLIAPRNETEAELLQIWEGVLDKRPIGVNDSFFDLGGHSMLALRLFDEIHRTFHRSLPLAALFEGPTIAHLAAALRAEERPGGDWAVVPMNIDGTRPPLFALPGIGGMAAFTFRKLAEQLGDDQPVYGLQLRGLDGKQAPCTRIDEMAAYHVRKMRSMNPQGPYCLMGYSFGGRVVFEMARQLLDEGHEVPLIVLLDSSAPGYPRIAHWSVRLSLHLKEIAERIAREGPREGLEYLHQRIGNLSRRLGHSRADSTAVATTKSGEVAKGPREQVRQATRIAAERYRPVPFSCKIVLFRTAERPDWLGATFEDPENGWGQYALGGVEVHMIPGKHLELFDSPNVDVLAEKLRAVVDSVVRSGLDRKLAGKS